MKLRELMEDVGGRRFLMAIGAGVVVSVLQWYGKLDPAGTAYATIVIGVVGAYIAGNTVEKMKAGNAA